MHPMFAELFLSAEDTLETDERGRLRHARRSRQLRTVSAARGKAGAAPAVPAGNKHRDRCVAASVTRHEQTAAFRAVSTCPCGQGWAPPQATGSDVGTAAKFREPGTWHPAGQRTSVRFLVGRFSSGPPAC
jgi:hypothetical protein